MDPVTARSCGYSRLYLRGDAIPTIFNFKSFKRKNEENAKEMTKARKSNAIVKMTAHKTLKGLEEKKIEMAVGPEVVDIEEDNPEPCTIATLQANVQENKTFNSFTETPPFQPYFRVQRRHAAVQADIQVEPVKKQID